MPKLSAEQFAAFSKIQPKIDQIITGIVEKGDFEWDKVADALNKEGLHSPTGLRWAGHLVNGYALKHQLSTRKRPTSRGDVGSTGVPTRAPNGAVYSPMNGLNTAPPKKRMKKPSTDTVTEKEVEEIMTSNLDTSLKLKVIRIVALGKLHG